MRAAGPDAALGRLLRRDRTVALALLAAVAAAAWAYTLAGAGMEAVDESGGMAGMPGMEGMAGMADEAPARPFVLFAMWWVMMVAMMLPSAAPMILLFAAVERRRQRDRPPVPTVLFAASYLVAWGGFAALAAGAQAAAQSAGLIGPDMALGSRSAAGVLLLAAGLYQLTPPKRACLRRCREPARFLAEHWRPGPAGALRMGLVHGAYCLGCCWALMLLLFVGGVMSPLWIGALALFVLAEKALPAGPVLGRAAGLVMAATGAWLVSGTAWAS